jgi:hypothetical protein
VAALLTATTARADPPAPAPGVSLLPRPPSTPARPPVDPQELRESGARLRTGGIALTLFGVALLAAGGGLLGAGFHASDDNGRIANFATSIICFSLGGVALVPGAVIWGVGQSRIDRAARLEGATIGLAPAPAGSVGGGLALRF